MKKVITIILLSSLFSIFLCFGKNLNHDNVLLLANNIVKTQSVSLADISSANVSSFDNPSIGENGILQRVPSFEINTKYGNMQISQQQYGYIATNLSNVNAPKLYVGTLNGIFKVGGGNGISELIAPKIIDGNSGDKIILPTVNTQQQNFNATYVEAINSNGDITIAPFIYNTVKFKTSVNVASKSDIKNLTLSDVLESSNNSASDLKIYVANYDGTNVNVGISRGMTSIQEPIKVNVGTKATSTNTSTLAKMNVAKVGDLHQSTTPTSTSTITKLVLGKTAYIVLGVILSLIIAFVCFIYKKRSRTKVGVGIILITIVIVGLGFTHQYLNFTYGTYINSGNYRPASGGVISQLSNIVTGDSYKKPINTVGNLKAEYESAKKVNSSVIGWIFIDGTNINYPILHGKDDEYYLTHNWKGDPFWNGSIFLDHANSGFNNVSLINGHNMLNGIMFSELINFKNKDFFDADHKIYIYNGETNKQEVFEAIGALYVEPTIKLNLGNISSSEKQKEVESLMSQSMYKKQAYNGNDVLLLNTCLSNGSGKHLLVVTQEVN
ncbi:MAG: class B sortase [Sarcina sp.]